MPRGCRDPGYALRSVGMNCVHYADRSGRGQVGGIALAHGDLTHLFGMVAPRLRKAARTPPRHARLHIAPLVLAAALLGQGGAHGQTTITATSAQDYATAITDANGTPSSTVTVINSPPGTVILLGTITLPALGSGSTLQIGNGTVNSPISGGTITDNGTLSFTVPNESNDKMTTILTGIGTVTVQGYGGNLVVETTNSYTGGTTINSATMILGYLAEGTVGTGAVTLSNPGALQFTEPSPITFANVIGGDGYVI